jgi:hypothetical protein
MDAGRSRLSSSKAQLGAFSPQGRHPLATFALQQEQLPMKSWQFWLICGCALTLCKFAAAEAITLQSLLEEQTQPARLARFPFPEYRQLQSSSYNRQSTARDQADQSVSGWFADSDGLAFIRREEHDGQPEWVIMEHEGPGCLTKFWTPYFYRDFHNRTGPRVRIYLDGSPEPVIDATFIELMTRNQWPDSYGPRPVATNSLVVPSPFADFTARAGNLYLPIPFAKHCKVTLTEPPFYHIVNYRAYEPTAQVETFTFETYRKAADTIAMASRALLHPKASVESSTEIQTFELSSGEELQLTLPAGSHAIESFQVVFDPDQIATLPQLLRSTLLTMRFDEEETVWTPVGDFFGSPNAVNPMHTWTRTVTSEGRMTCRWVMPYAKSGSICLTHLGDTAVKLKGKLIVATIPWQWDDRSMHFFARWRPDDIQRGDQFVDWNFVDIRGKGVFVGDTWTVLNLTRGWWGEGDEKIYVDDAYDVRKFPDHFGTGTEDYYGWAGGVNPTREDVFNHPFLANISVGSTAESNTRGFNVSARIRSLDAIPFTERLVFDMEASPGTEQRNRWDQLGYSVVTAFYALRGLRPIDLPYRKPYANR